MTCQIHTYVVAIDGNLKNRSITPIPVELSESVGTLEDVESSLASTVIDTHNPQHLCQLGIKLVNSHVV